MRVVESMSPPKEGGCGIDRSLTQGHVDFTNNCSESLILGGAIPGCSSISCCVFACACCAALQSGGSAPAVVAEWQTHRPLEEPEVIAGNVVSAWRKVGHGKVVGADEGVASSGAIWSRVVTKGKGHSL